MGSIPPTLPLSLAVILSTARGRMRLEVQDRERRWNITLCARCGCDKGLQPAALALSGALGCPAGTRAGQR